MFASFGVMINGGDVHSETLDDAFPSLNKEIPYRQMYI